MAIKRIAPKMYTFRSVLLEMFFGIELCNNFGKFTTNSNNIEENVSDSAHPNMQSTLNIVDVVWKHC